MFMLVARLKNNKQETIIVNLLKGQYRYVYNSKRTFYTLMVQLMSPFILLICVFLNYFFIVHFKYLVFSTPEHFGSFLLPLSLFSLIFKTFLSLTGLGIEWPIVCDTFLLVFVFSMLTWLIMLYIGILHTPVYVQILTDATFTAHEFRIFTIYPKEPVQNNIYRAI